MDTCPLCGSALDDTDTCTLCGWYDGREIEPLDDSDLALLHAHAVKA